MFGEKDSPIVVVCAADNNYAMPLAVTIRSAIENLEDGYRLDLYIIDGGISEQNRTKIVKTLNSAKCRVNWLQKPDISLFQKILGSSNWMPDDLPISHHITVAAYYRILIPELLPNACKKAIYLDCDLIVSASLHELWNIDIGENYALAVQEVLTPYVSSPNGLSNYRELGLPQKCEYLTSGVLVLNLEKWREEHICAQCINYIFKNKEYIRSHDTDVLNAILAGRWGKLAPSWNQMPFIYECKTWEDSPYPEQDFHDAVNNPCIIHYATSAKPWNSLHKHPFRYLFYVFLDKTEWAGWRFTFWSYIKRWVNQELESLKADRQAWISTFGERFQGRLRKAFKYITTS